VNGKVILPDWIKLDDFSWNMILDNKNFHCILLDFNPSSKTWTIEINGKRVKASVTPAMDKLLKEIEIDTNEAEN
jgi:hypothetical protein